MTDSNLVLSQPESETPGMVAPGQENLLEEFVAEQEQEEQQKLLGKFNSPEELAKAYQELEKKLGQGSKPDPAVPSDEASPQTQGYTSEQAVQVYGQEAVELLAGKGVDLAEVMWQADQGKDISSHYDTLAEAFNVPRQLVENYVSKAQAAPAAQGTGLSDQDASELKAMVGGDEGFQQLSQWAASNLDPTELADYNAVVDSGNKQAISWALKAIQAKITGAAAPAEPKLISGGRPPAVEKFESKQQVLDAMNKRNDKGQKLYEVDEAYRGKFMQILARSEVFV
jgi:hypothetical protein